MARFLIESRHTARECVWAVGQVHQHGAGELEKYEWGCKDGVHVGWAIVDADTKFDVSATVPRVLRPQTRIVQLNRFSPDEVKAYHEGELAPVATPVGAR